LPSGISSQSEVRMFSGGSQNRAVLRTAAKQKTPPGSLRGVAKDRNPNVPVVDGQQDGTMFGQSTRGASRRHFDRQLPPGLTAGRLDLVQGFHFHVGPFRLDLVQF